MQDENHRYYQSRILTGDTDAAWYYWMSEEMMYEAETHGTLSESYRSAVVSRSLPVLKLLLVSFNVCNRFLLLSFAFIFMIITNNGWLVVRIGIQYLRNTTAEMSSRFNTMSQLFLSRLQINISMQLCIRIASQAKPTMSETRSLCGH